MGLLAFALERTCLKLRFSEKSTVSCSLPDFGVTTD